MDAELPLRRAAAPKETTRHAGGHGSSVVSSRGKA
jgi:hypothetical protein